MNNLLLKLQEIKFENRLRKNISPDKYDYLLFGFNDVMSRGKTESKNNQKYPEIYQLLKDLVKEQDDKFTFTGIIINKNKKCNIHKDKGNIFKS